MHNALTLYNATANVNISLLVGILTGHGLPNLPLFSPLPIAPLKLELHASFHLSLVLTAPSRFYIKTKKNYFTKLAEKKK